jgi:serine/threonine protein kinase
MAIVERCDRCGAELSASAMKGLCAACMLKEGLLTPPIPHDATPADFAPPVFELETPDFIGGYQILEVIGQGGMGIVYLAEQTKPVRRQVALKIIKVGMDTGEVIRRFEAERQALAMMDHSNIARVLDAGATDTGRPYFVMEWVRGPRITNFCDENRLSIKERLKLFVQVCRAVQHAHQKGVIHRDLKPSNILVATEDGLPAPKIIDFGIVKATGVALMENSISTGIGQLMGTPAYMSPEQMKMGRTVIDTRSDIYSLGVLLYELVTGKTPFDSTELLGHGLSHMQRIILGQEPPRASARFASLPRDERKAVARCRDVWALRLTEILREDLDWVAGKALMKDRSSRYETANGLAMDVQRFLENRAVLARPSHVPYKLRKLLTRHRMVAAVAALVAVGCIGAIWGATQLVDNRRQARIDRLTSDFLTGVFNSVDSASTNTHPASASEMLEAAGRNIGPAFPGEPLTELAIRQRMAEIALKIGRPDIGLVQAKAAARLALLAHGREDDPALLESLNLEGQAEARLGDDAKALPRLQEALAMGQRLLKAHPENPACQMDVAEVHRTLGELYAGGGNTNAALDHYRDGLKIVDSLRAAGEDGARLDQLHSSFETRLKSPFTKTGQ